MVGVGNVHNEFYRGCFSWVSTFENALDYILILLGQ